MTRCGLNLYGHLSSSIGVGAAARNTAHSLDSLGVPFVAVNVAPTPPPEQQPMGDELHVVEAGVRPPYDINLFHMNPPEIREFLNSPDAVVPLTHFNAAVPFWELSELPGSWVECLGAMDAVLAPSIFLRDMIERAIPGLPVLHFPQGIRLPAHVRVDRDRWGMESDATVFVCGFDLRSGMTRKNPLGVIAAFNAAFGESEAVQLIIRVNNAQSPDYQSDMVTLVEATGGRVRLLLEPLSYPEVLSFYASADVYVSLHRAEGLGLGLLEAMSLGMPVIATAYSGNMDFMNADTGMLVDYRLVPVAPSLVYGAPHDGQQWADPDIDQAATAMRTLHQDVSLRQSFGLRAAARAAEVNSVHAAGAVFEELCKLAAMTPRGRRHYHLIRKLAVVGPRERRRRRVVALLRAFKLKAPAPVGEAPPVYPVVTGPEGLGSAHGTQGGGEQ